MLERPLHEVLAAARDQDRKPPFSFITQIALAIVDTPEWKKTVSEIYAWLKDKFPYYRTVKHQGWQVQF